MTSSLLRILWQMSYGILEQTHMSSGGLDHLTQNRDIAHKTVEGGKIFDPSQWCFRKIRSILTQMKENPLWWLFAVLYKFICIDNAVMPYGLMMHWKINLNKNKIPGVCVCLPRLGLLPDSGRLEGPLPGSRTSICVFCAPWCELLCEC